MRQKASQLGVFFGLFLALLATEFQGRAIAANIDPPADGSMPACLDNASKPMSIDNARVLQFKFWTKNQFKERGFVQGKVSRLFGRKGDHTHFEIQIGEGPKDTVEIIFNRDFGNLAVEIGEDVIACGDYITSYAKYKGYDASPSGALIHWVHENERGTAHPDGFVIVNQSELHGYGQTVRPVRVGQ